MRRLLLPVSVAAALTLAVPAIAAAPATYKGKTSQNRTVTLTVKAGTVTAFSAGVNMMCNQAGLEFNAAIPPTPIAVKGGRLHYAGRDKIDSVNLVIDGTVKGSTVKGKVKMTDSRYDAYNETYDSCVGSATFTAKAR
jgi:hypothetical protein